MLPSCAVPPQTKVADVQFDPDGDIILILPLKSTPFSGSAKRIARFRVNSGNLCLVSPVFRAMLGENSQFKERSALINRNPSSPPIEIPLQDDDPSALALLMRVVHLQSAWVPKELKDDQLYEVAIVCGKYDMDPVVNMWLDQWIPPNTEVGGDVKGDRWLFIAYTFGREELFRQLSKDLILTCSPGLSGSLNFPGAGAYIQMPFNKHIPALVVSEIATRRRLAITNILASINRMITRYGKILGDSLLCAHDPQSDCCDTFFFGFLLNAFKKFRTTSLLLDNTSTSIQELQTLVGKLIGPDFLAFEAVPICRRSRPRPNLESENRASGSRPDCPHDGNANPNHAFTCSPIPKLKSELDVYFSMIQGLDWKSYAKNPKENPGRGFDVAPPAGGNTWDYLTYK